jgi:hypothetical protein
MNTLNQLKSGSTKSSTEKIKVLWKYTNYYKKVIIYSWERKRLPGYIEKRFPKGKDDEQCIGLFDTDSGDWP